MSDSEVVAIETETVATVEALQTRLVSVESETDNEVHITIEDHSPDAVSVTPESYSLTLVAGDIYFADIEEDLITGVVKQNDFTVLYDGEGVWNIPSQARRILHVMINQIDYVDDCEITPIGSGKVVYTVPHNGYEVEAGDRVYIYWSL